MKKIDFITGLPRAGSTLLTNILNSNPNHFVTPTSGLIDTFMTIKNNWRNNDLYKTEGIEKIKPRILCAMKAFLQGYFEPEKGGVAFDKNRGWMAHTTIMDEVLDDYKMIVCVRDVKSIVGSFEKLHRKNGIEANHFGDDFIQAQSPEGRAEIWLKPGGLVGLPIARLRDALRCNPKNLIIVPFIQLVTEPKIVMERLHEQMGLEPYEYDFDNVKQTVTETDIIHGWKDLHVIRPKIEPPELPGWHGLYAEDYLKELDNRYLDISKMSTY